MINQASPEIGHFLPLKTLKSRAKLKEKPGKWVGPHIITLNKNYTHSKRAYKEPKLLLFYFHL